MIKSFSNRALEDFYIDGLKKKIKADHIKKLERILDRLDQSSDVEKDMNYPGSDLHKLEPKKNNRWSVSVSGNWRVTFVFKDGDAYEVDYRDYH
jgi:proteic killer suppression protein